MGKVIAIILAAGKGKRMGTKRQKQFLEVNGKPLFLFSIEAFEKSKTDEIIVVTNSENIDYCKRTIKEAGYKKVSGVVEGGNERYNSVYNALISIKEADYVLIHDAARPAITYNMINEIIERVFELKACIFAVPVKDTIKKTDKENNITETLDRKILWQAQTPQAFDFVLIKNAYNYVLKEKENIVETITDDSMMIEIFNPEQKVHIINGSYSNIKVTTIEDLSAIENILKI